MPVYGIFRQHDLHVFLPQFFAGLQVNANQVANEILDFAGALLAQSVTGIAGDERFAAHNDRARGSRPGQLGFPGEVGRRRPGGRQRFYLSSHTRTVRTAETWPVLSVRHEAAKHQHCQS